MAGERKLRILESFKRLRPKSAIGKKFISKLSNAAKIFLLVIFFFTFSIGLTFYNKKVIKVYQLPLSMTVIHLVVKFIIASWIRSIVECYTKKARVTLSWSEYIKRVSLAGIFTGLDIGMSNWSFQFITVSLYTMTKSSSVIFILLFSLCFKLEKFTWTLLVVVALICVGLFLFTYESTQFEWHGFVIVLSAAVLSGLRCTLTQIALQRQELGLSHPVDMMYHMEPWMLTGLLPLVVGIEGVKVSTSQFAFHYHDSTVVMTTLLLALAGAGQSFFLELSEFLLLYHTSSLTLAISGIIKELCTLYIAYEFTGDRMSAINAVGLVVCVGGIIVHTYLKYRHSKRTSTEQSDVEGKISEQIGMLLRNGEANISDVNDDDDDDDIELFNSASFRRR